MNEEYHKVYPSLTRGTKSIPPETNEPVQPPVVSDSIFSNHKALIICISIIITVLIVALVYMATKTQSDILEDCQNRKARLKGESKDVSRPTGESKDASRGAAESKDAGRRAGESDAHYESGDASRHTAESGDASRHTAESGDAGRHTAESNDASRGAAEPKDDSEGVLEPIKTTEPAETDYEKEAALIIEHINKQRDASPEHNTAAGRPVKQEEMLSEMINIPKYLREATKNYPDDAGIQLLAAERVPMRALVELKDDWNNEDFIRFIGTKKIRDKINMIEELN